MRMLFLILSLLVISQSAFPARGGGGGSYSGLGGAGGIGSFMPSSEAGPEYRSGNFADEFIRLG